MQVKCEYCGAYISDSDEFCNQCGAVNPNYNRSTDGTPKTIPELKAWYRSKNLPPENVTRFFIGTNCTEARAIGIYEENGEYIVYKNKNDGTRAVRYKGKDEAYAVNEIYLKLKSEILNQKAHNINNQKNNDGSKNKSSFSDKVNMLLGSLLIVGVAIMVVLTIVSFVQGVIGTIKDIPYAGNYYEYDDGVYYCESYVDDDWYLYDYDNRDYLPVSIPSEMYADIQNYKFSEGDEWFDSIERFEDTEMGQYVESLHESSDSDSDYDWDSDDSWDSDYSDWDSDW